MEKKKILNIKMNPKINMISMKKIKMKKMKNIKEMKALKGKINKNLLKREENLKIRKKRIIKKENMKMTLMKNTKLRTKL